MIDKHSSSFPVVSRHVVSGGHHSIERAFEETPAFLIGLDIRDISGAFVMGCQHWVVPQIGAFRDHLHLVNNFHEEQVSYSRRIAFKPLTIAQLRLY